MKVVLIKGNHMISSRLFLGKKKKFQGCYTKILYDMEFVQFLPTQYTNRLKARCLFT